MTAAGERLRSFLAWAIAGVTRGVMLWAVKIDGKPITIGIWVKWVICAGGVQPRYTPIQL